MRTLLLVAAIFTLTLTSQAQQAARLIFWTSEPECGFRSPSFTPQDKISCTSLMTERGPVSVASLNGVSLAVAFLERGDYIIASARITNRSLQPVMFDTDLWGAAHFQTTSENRAKEKPLAAETSVPSRDIIRQLRGDRSLNAAADLTAAESQMKGQPRELRRSDGTRYRVVDIVPDVEAQNAAVRRGKARAEQVILEQNRIRETALTGKWAAAGGFAQGLVYFRRFKEAELVVFSLSVGGTTFVFQLPTTRN